jgi:hypothetical protein
VILLAALLSAGPAAADLSLCAALDRDAERLACYDRLAGRAQMAAFSGKGGGVTPPFTVTAPTLLRFESADAIMVVYLLNADGTVAQNLHKGGVGVGEHLIETPGAYSVQVNASGGWRVWLAPAGNNGNSAP